MNIFLFVRLSFHSGQEYGVLANGTTSLMFLAPRRNCARRSKPRPKPPVGEEPPRRRRSTYLVK